MEPQNPFALLSRQQDDPGRFKSPAHLIACRLIDPETAFGFEALERGQRYASLVGERLLRLSQ